MQSSFTPFFVRIFVFLLFFSTCDAPDPLIELQRGMTINESATIQPGRYFFKGNSGLDEPAITVSGEDVTIDFNGAEINGSSEGELPNEYKGLGVKITGGKNITIKNLRIRGFKVALYAEGVDSLKLLDCDFSYNYRDRLYSLPERENLSDWLSYHNNEEDEWLRYGAGAYLKSCNRAVVRNLRVTGGQNGLMLTGCSDGLFYNNTIHFNSGIGIGLYRSSRNRIMHNRLDWNVRGFSYGFYARGQDSAGILCYEQSQENIFAYNSATHSGDGFFLWAGQETMDTGEGGCNDNIIYGNDFSFAPTNGIEVTFSKNDIIENRMEGCRYGLWGGYSFGSVILGNRFIGNTYGVAIEHGNNNVVNANVFEENEVGVQLWERMQQPGDWGFAQKRDVRSRAYTIQGNVFRGDEIPLEINRTADVEVSDNIFLDFDLLLESEIPNEGFGFRNNKMDTTVGWGKAAAFLAGNDVVSDLRFEDPVSGALYPSEKVRPLTDGMDAMLPESHPRGRPFMLVDEWGPFDFRSPSVWLRDVDGENYTFLLVGPQGNWKLTGGEGFINVNQKTGTFPATLTAKKEPGAAHLRLDFEFIGEAVTTRFGEELDRGTPVPFRFSRFEQPLSWRVRWYEYDDTRLPLENYEAFRQLRKRSPDHETQTDTLAYTWWGSPGGDVDADRFATFAEASPTFPPGRYRIVLTSDDGVRLYLDGERLIDHWDVHTPAVDEIEVRLEGTHRIEIEHFEAGGLANLDFVIVPIKETRELE